MIIRRFEFYVPSDVFSRIIRRLTDAARAGRPNLLLHPVRAVRALTRRACQLRVKRRLPTATTCCFSSNNRRLPTRGGEFDRKLWENT